MSSHSKVRQSAMSGHSKIRQSNMSGQSQVRPANMSGHSKVRLANMPNHNNARSYQEVEYDEQKEPQSDGKGRGEWEKLMKKAHADLSTGERAQAALTMLESGMILRDENKITSIPMKLRREFARTVFSLIE